MAKARVLRVEDVQGICDYGQNRLRGMFPDGIPLTKKSVESLLAEDFVPTLRHLPHRLRKGLKKHAAAQRKIYDDAARKALRIDRAYQVAREKADKEADRKIALLTLKHVR